MKNLFWAFGLPLTSALTCTSAAATTYYYVGASNEWTTAACYSTTPGGAGGAGVPGSDDRVVLSAGTKAFVHDDTIAFFSTIKEVQVAGHNVAITFNITADANLDCNLGSFNSSAWTSYLVKTGAGRLTVAKKCPNEYIVGGHCYGNFIGLDVREGSLVMEPSTGNNYHRYSDVRIAEGATVYGVTSGVTWLNTLNGAGTLTTTGSSAELRIAGVGASPCVFSGIISGYKIFRPSGHVWLTGTSSTMAPGADNFIPYNYSGLIDRGVFGFTTWAGGYNTPSSFGTGNLDASGGSFRFLYLGTTGETIGRSITLRNTIAAPATIDAGAYGGLVFSGLFAPKDTIKKQQRFEFTGSNTVHACIFSNQFQKITADGKDCSFYVKKTGSGIWRFANRDATDQMSGVIAAEQGTLEFETLRNRGFTCSLGDATDLYEDKCDVPANLAAVPYANVVGDGTANEAVLSYVGADALYVYDRPLAVKGAGRFRAPNAPAYALSGFRALGSGDSKIVFECAAGQVNKVSGFVDENTTGGEGTLSIEKDGPGDLVVSGDLSFGGDLIAKGGGTLTVKDVNGRVYRYYRLNVKESAAISDLPEYASCHQVAGGEYTRKLILNEFGLYNANKQRLNRFHYNGYATNRYVATLSTSKIALENEDLFTIANANNANVGGVGRLVDNYNSGGIVCNLGWTSTSRVLNPSDPSTWIRVVQRFVDTAAEIKYFDLNYAYPFGHGYFGGSPTAFSIEASADCLTWEELYATNNIVFTPSSAYCWLSDGASSSGSAEPETAAHAKIALPYSKVHLTYATLDNLRAISVARGTTLKYDGSGAAPVVRALLANAAGVGTVDGFAFASSGDLVVEQADEGTSCIHVAADFSQVSNASYGNLANWRLTVNGRCSTRYAIGKVTATGIDIYKRGMAVILR